MSIGIEVSGEFDLRSVIERTQRLAKPENKRKLLGLIGAEVGSQTHERFRDTKESPDGSSWESWSLGYAKRREGQHSLLMSSGDLDESIQSFVKGSTAVHVGSPLSYAHVHQDGFNGSVQMPTHVRRITQAFGRALKFPVYQTVGSHSRTMNIPQRQYLGLSSDNQKELLTLIARFNQELLE